MTGSTRDDPESSCEGKKRFDSFRHAEKVCERDREKGRRPYHCTFCNSFHIGERVQKRIRRPRPALDE